MVEAMGFRIIICGLCAVAVIALSALAAQSAEHDFKHITTEAEKVPAIAACLQQNLEVVLVSNAVICRDYRDGATFLGHESPSTPFDFDATNGCAKEPAAPVDARRLGADLVQRLLNDPKLKVGSFGIRIFGAIFCERVNLVGLELPFSLVLDKSVFAKGIEIRNLRIKGDLSFDGALILEQLRIIRSHLEGSLFAEKSFVQQLQIANSTLDSSALFTESVLFESTQLFNLSIARELSIRGSALSYFVTQFSNIGGSLDLSHSQARCAYHINKSEIGYLVARETGFGTIEPPGYYVWREDDLTAPVQHILSIPKIQKIIQGGDQCVNPSGRPQRAEFFIFDSIIKSSLCVNQFRWLAPRDAGPYTSQDFFTPRRNTEEYLRTVIAINGNAIGSNLIIDLWPQDTGEKNLNYEVSARLHKFEAIGVKAGGLVIDFAERNQNHVITAVDGLQFERLYNGHASCEYGGSEASPLYDDRSLLLISDFKDALELPKVEDALRWLDLNTIGSTQPYTAFATAFRNAGVDSAPIIIARENRELCERAARWVPLAILKNVCRDLSSDRGDNAGDPSRNLSNLKLRSNDTSDRAGHGWNQLGEALLSIPNQLSDLALLSFHGGLYFLADHGYRPGKVLWWITLTLCVFWALFLWPLKVVAYTSKAKSSTLEPQPLAGPKVRRIGFLFLFDRMLPAYQIDSAHYEIESYFKRIQISEMTSRVPPPPVVRRLFFFEWPIERITKQQEIDRIENLLVVLRVLGVVFAIFLAAAVSALIAH